MDFDVDDKDLLSLSERILPYTSTNIPNSIKSQKNLSSDNRIFNENDNPLPTTANIGDIMQYNDGTRKKYNGTNWRRMCSKPDCSYYSQSKGLCKPHLASLKKRKSLTTKDDDLTTSLDQISTEQEEPKKGDIITLENGIRKKFDGRQYRRICANPICTVTVNGSIEYQNGLCPHHYQEFHAENLSEISSPSRKRRRANSPSSLIPTQVPVPFNIQSSIPKASHRLSIAVIPPSVDINNPKKGDIIDMENGSRKKFDGVVWRKICSIPGCFIAAQRDELCRKHFIKLNGKPLNGSTMDTTEPATMVKPILTSISSRSTSSTEDKSRFRTSTKIKDEPEESNSYHASGDDTQPNEHDQENSSAIDDNHFGAQLDHSLINSLSSSREKFPTNHLKKWLREHRSHPYPSNQEKIELAKQSSITYDQVTTWFNNARAILRRHQAKLRHSFDTADDDDDREEEFLHENDDYSDKMSSKVPRSFPLFNGVYCRSIGVQCSPSTVNQTTATSTTISEDDCITDRSMRVLTPSSHILKTLNSIKQEESEEFLVNGINTEDIEKDQQMIMTSTCLDDDQMARLKEFCSRFDIKFSDNVDQYTTHLITDEEEGETLVCPLSKKVIQAVAHHMYIVTYRWIDACLKSNQILNEKPFEIQGDLTLSSDHHGMQRSRQSLLPIKSLLLENYSIMLKCDGCQEMLNHDELTELVQLSGAKLTRDSHFSRLQTGLIRVVLCEKEYLINRKEMYEKCLHAGVHFLTPEWFLESLVQYRIQPYQEYQISP